MVTCHRFLSLKPFPYKKPEAKNRSKEQNKKPFENRLEQLRSLR